VLIPSDPGRDARAFHPVLSRIEQLVPGAEPLQPGLVAVRARGPARFFGGEGLAARALLDALAEIGLAGARAGIADGLFTAERAARAAGADPLAIPAGRAADFLAPLPATSLGDPDLAVFLARLGVRRLGEFAALPEELVRDRLGSHGVRLRALASGADSRPVVPRVPPPDLQRTLDLEPPLELAEQVAFAVRRTADSFLKGLSEAALVCTALRVVIETDRGERSERVWQHPSCFDAAGVIDRVRWQLQPAPGTAPFTGGVCRVEIEPEAVDDGALHQPALLGQGPDERAHHAMTRVQAGLGHRGVMTAVPSGGRWLVEREELAPWGEAVPPSSPRELPWPGSLPDPLPSEVFREPRPVHVAGADGKTVSVDDRGFLTAAPATVDGCGVVSWAGPWPVVERTWDPSRMRRAHRFQLVDDRGSAWLAVLEGTAWVLEGRYA
jgi:protein ImuB